MCAYILLLFYIVSEFLCEINKRRKRPGGNMSGEYVPGEYFQGEMSGSPHL